MTTLAPNALGMGCWQLGGASNFGGRINGYGSLADDDAFTTVRSAFESGIRFFDTADAYGRGLSERRLGEALGKDRVNAIICTKFGAREDQSGTAFHDFSPSYMERAIDGSLARLGTDYLDILLLHGPPDDMDWNNFNRSGLEAALKDERIRAYGVSTRSVHGARNVIRSGFGSYVETVFNAIDRRATPLLEEAALNGQRIIARVALASGFLTARGLMAASPFPTDDIRSTFPEDQTKWVRDAVHSLAFLDELPGGIAVSALRFVIHQPGVNVTIPGMRSIGQVEQSVLALELGPLPVSIVERITRAVPDVFHRWK